jgi:hypothetical protein
VSPSPEVFLCLCWHRAWGGEGTSSGDTLSLSCLEGIDLDQGSTLPDMQQQ